MKTFSELITEISKQILNVKWNNWKNDKLNGFFNNEGNDFEIEFSKEPDGVYTIKFFRYDENGERQIKMFNDSKSVGNVIMTITNEVHKFIKNENPRIIIFLGSLNEKGRIRVYDKYMIKIAEKHGFKTETELTDSDKVYIMHKLPDDKIENKLEELKEIINKIRL